MSKIRRSLIISQNSEIGPTPSSYIQQDLIFQLDGIDKGNISGAWTDLINGYSFTGNATQLNNGWDFNGSQKLTCNTSGGIYELNSNCTWTIEIAFHMKNPSEWGALFVPDWTFGNSSKHFNLAYGVYNGIPSLFGGSSYLHDGQTLYGYNVTPNSDVTFSMFCNKSTAFLNTRMTNYSNKKPTLASNYQYMRIGGRIRNDGVTNGYSKVTIYSIRVYNRELSQTEMLFNQQLDIQRFNLNIS